MSLRNKLREHYAQKRLAPEKLERLVALARPRRRVWLWPTTVAAALLVAAGLLWMRTDAVHDVAVEIAANHRRAYAAEFETTSYDELRERMERLDFVLLAPELSGLTLRGARYCSLRGRVACQLHLEDAAGRAHSLYQVRLDDVGDATVELGDLEVRLWNKGGLLLGLARPR